MGEAGKGRPFPTFYIGVNATLRDYAWLGMLLANDGTLDGRPIIPAGCVREATTPPGEPFELGQTRSFFRLRLPNMGTARRGAAVCAAGSAGTGVFVDPKSKLVMVHTAARDVGDAGRETLPLWLAIVKTLAKRGGSSLPTIAHRA